MLQSLLDQPAVLWIGLFLLFGGVWWITDSVRFGLRATLARGRFVEYDTRYSQRGARHYPVFEFETPDGVTHRGRSAFSHKIQRWFPGSSLEIHYDPAEPHRARLRSGLLEVIRPAWAISVGLFLVFYGAPLMRAKGL